MAVRRAAAPGQPGKGGRAGRQVPGSGSESRGVEMRRRQPMVTAGRVTSLAAAAAAAALASRRVFGRGEERTRRGERGLPPPPPLLGGAWLWLGRVPLYGQEK